ncbi:MAG TPA: uroporphyrinogen decarboxylase family protein [Anaerolineales bacterium]|nr:uroporphyrinogen decarboxylase family protein [Anaerolineales bacterium]
MSSRADILSLLHGNKLPSPPAFSGLIHVTAEGLQSEGLSLHEVHHDAKKMAKASASTFKLTGMPSATLPLDLCAPAEALGAELNYEGEGFPQVMRAVVESAKVIGELVNSNLRLGTGGGRVAPNDFRGAYRDQRLETGRLEIVCEAIRLVREDIENEVVISGMIPGPYTLLLYLCDLKNLFIEMKKEPQVVLDALFHLSSFLAKIGNAYRDSGVDFITIHEMGGSPGFIGPAKFEQFVLPALRELHASLPSPRVLSVCGNTNKSAAALAESGADAVSVDQVNDLAASREILKDTLLFGNLDPVATLWKGDEAEVVESTRRAKEAGVDAVWPGCDLVPSTPIRNLKAMMM